MREKTRPHARVPAAAGCLLAVALLLTPPARADVVTIGLVQADIRDNTLYESATGNLSDGAGSFMFVGRTNQPQNSRRRAVLRFNVAGNIPAGSTINSAILTLNMSQTASPDQTIQMRKLTADWGEGTSNATVGGGGRGAPSTTNDATWIHRFFPNLPGWTTAGGDFSATVSASQVVGALGSYTWTSAQLVTDIQAMLDTPSGNFGWLLLGDETQPLTAKRFDSRENAVANRPRLSVDFTPVPEPGSAALTLLAIGSCLLGCRMRHRKQLAQDRLKCSGPAGGTALLRDQAERP